MQRLKHRNIYQSIIYIRKVATYICVTEEYFNELWYLHTMMYQNVYKSFLENNTMLSHFPSIKFRNSPLHIYSMTSSMLKVSWQKPEKKNTSGLSMDATISGNSFISFIPLHMCLIFTIGKYYFYKKKNKLLRLSNCLSMLWYNFAFMLIS